MDTIYFNAGSLCIFAGMKNFLSLVKFSHTIFAMPFAMVGFFVATVVAGGQMNWLKFGLVVACMVFARNAAMAFNRWLDRDIDAANPRTQVREIPAGIIAPQAAMGFVVANCLLFVAATWWLNPLCFGLSPVALAVVLGYSYTKRFTWMCHVVLGLGLSLAPLGAYLAVTGAFAWIPVLYSGAVLCWVAGFDVIYAMQDADFDRDQQLYSMPSFFGPKQALRISGWLHIGTAIFIILAGRHLASATDAVDWLLWLGTGVFLGLLVYQHWLVKPNDLSKVNQAFFTTNGIASLVYGSLVVLDLLA